MPLQHGQFIKYMQRLGYRSNTGGVCFGLAHMGLQAILCEDFESFEKRLQDIEEDIENNDRLGKLIAKTDIRKIEGITKDEISKLTDIRAFCDGVELYFQPQYYKDFFQDARPLSQDPIKTAPLIDSIKMTEQQGLYQADRFSGVYEEQDLVDLLKSLKEKIPNGYNKPIALVISSMGHSICVGYIPNLQEWVFINANSLPPKRLNEESLAREIKRSFRNTKKNILIGKVYSTKNSKEQVDNIISGWKNAKTYERIQTVTPEKARYVNDRNQTWLHYSAHVGDLPSTQDLLAKDADFDLKTVEGWAPLRLAVGSGHLEVVKALIHRGADVNAIGADDRTPLMLAALFGHLEVVNALIANGADVNARDANGRTPLMLAALFGHLEVLNALIANGADVNLKNADGRTPLMLAVEEGHFEVVSVLIAEGANVNIKDKDGKTALELASPELKEAMLKQIETQNEPASRKKLTFSDSREEEADSNTSSTVSHKPPTSKP